MRVHTHTHTLTYLSKGESKRAQVHISLCAKEVWLEWSAMNDLSCSISVSNENDGGEQAAGDHITGAGAACGVRRPMMGAWQLIQVTNIPVKWASHPTSSPNQPVFAICLGGQL